MAAHQGQCLILRFHVPDRDIRVVCRTAGQQSRGKSLRKPLAGAVSRPVCNSRDPHADTPEDTPVGACLSVCHRLHDKYHRPVLLGEIPVDAESLHASSRRRDQWPRGRRVLQQLLHCRPPCIECGRVRADSACPYSYRFLREEHAAGDFQTAGSGLETAACLPAAGPGIHLSRAACLVGGQIRTQQKGNSADILAGHHRLRRT